MGRKRQIIMKETKFPYEEPDFLKIEIRDAIFAFDSTESTTEPETENDDWGLGFIPF